MIQKTRANELLQKSLDAIPDLLKLPYGSEQFARWKRDTETIIGRIFPSDPRNLNDFKAIHFSPPPVEYAASGPNLAPTPRENPAFFYEAGLRRANVVLQSMINEIDTFWDDVKTLDSIDFWPLIHPEILAVSKGRFDAGEYADCAEAAFKHINSVVKDIVKKKTGRELDGADLMKHAFTPNNPVIVIEDITTLSGKSVQLGYMEIFSGVMSGIRNPKAHANITITRERAIHFLFVASTLMDTLDIAHNRYRF